MEKMSNRTYDLYAKALDNAKDREEREQIMNKLVRDYGADHPDVKDLDRFHNK